MKHLTTFTISKKPGAMALVVETSPFTINSNGATWKAEKTVSYEDTMINVYISIRGQKGQEFEMKMKINNNEQEIKGTLIKDGVNPITVAYNINVFFPAGVPVIASNVK